MTKKHTTGNRGLQPSAGDSPRNGRLGTSADRGLQPSAYGNNRHPAVNRNRPATQSQINRLFYEGMAWAVLNAPIPDTFKERVNGRTYTGEALRSVLPVIFAGKLIPTELKGYWFAKHVYPMMSEMLQSRGFDVPLSFADFFSALSFDAAFFLISGLTELKDNDSRYEDFRRRCLQVHTDEHNFKQSIFNFFKTLGRKTHGNS